mmetsp:Transcript_17081/g.25264  ORF Transcript_17081/g.25264 Transcript_17081/m.25264 type:complete len:133 (+) Transcript_17081:11-409(+)
MKNEEKTKEGSPIPNTRDQPFINPEDVPGNAANADPVARAVPDDRPVQATVISQPGGGPPPQNIVIIFDQNATCPYCGYSGPIASRIIGPGITAWLWCMVLLFLFWPLMWLPFVMDSCMDRELICANCRRPI